MSGSLDKQRKAFKADPDNTHAFEALEEHYFLQGEWKSLVAIYGHRLQGESLRNNPVKSAPLVFRLAQIVEERLEDSDLALEHYKQCARLDPKYRPALAQLRQIHASRGQWDVVLQIAEVENDSNMPPEERAEFLAEMGGLWLEHLRDPNEALSRFQESLGMVENQPAALAGLGNALEQLDRHPAAAQAWERLGEHTSGIERAEAHVRLARLLAGPLRNPERAMDFYRRAASDDRNNEEAICAIIIDATAKEQWSLLPEHYERRWDLAKGAKRRTTVAIEAGHLHLERLGDLATARHWFERALEFAPDDPAVHHSLAELARRSDDAEGLKRSLDHIIAGRGDDAPVSVLLEAADCHSSSGENERALELLMQARGGAPEDSLVLDALSDTLSEMNHISELCDVLETRAGLASDDAELQAEIYSELGRRQQDDLGDADAARSAYERSFHANPEAPGVASRVAELLAKAEAWDDLARHLERARCEGPQGDRGEFHCALGELQLDRNDDPSGAIAAFEDALTTSPELPRALRGLVRAAVASGDEDAQIRAYQREVPMAQHERREFATAELARLLEARGRIPEAIEALESLAGGSPSGSAGPGTRSHLQQIARLAALPDPNDPAGPPVDRDKLISALERLDEVIVRDEPDAFDASVEIRLRLAGLCAEAGRSERAIHWYESSLQAEPDNPEALLALRECYNVETQPDERIRVERGLARVLPEAERADALAELASLLEEHSGDFEGAIDALRSLLAMPCARQSQNAAKGQPGSVYEDRLATLLEVTGQFEALAEELQKRRQQRSPEPPEPEALALDLRLAEILLGRLERGREAAQLYREIFAKYPDNSEASAGLERATRMEGDPATLAPLLAELSQVENDPARRSLLRFERASLLEESLDDPDAALAGFRKVLDSDASPALKNAATQRCDGLLERRGDFAGLRVSLEAQLRSLKTQSTQSTCTESQSEIQALHARLAVLCREKLSDTGGRIEHLEAIAVLTPLDGRPWRELSTIYAELDRPSDLLRVATAVLSSSPPVDEQVALHLKIVRLCLDQESAESDREAVAHSERLLRLDRGHAEASELLCAHYERADQPAEIVRVLEARLRSLVDGAASGEPGAPGDSHTSVDNRRTPQALARTALRLRIARLRANELSDLSGAIDTLEPALEDDELLSAVAEPLAALYESAHRAEALALLCRRCAEQSSDDGHRIRWQLRLAQALVDGLDRRDKHSSRDPKDRGDRREESEDAVRVYREILESRPQQPEARAKLLDLYRDRGDHEPLARMLERELALKPEDELETLEELAPLLEEPLGQPEAALPHWVRILEVQPAREVAFEHALSLSRNLEEHETQLELIERRLQLDLRAEHSMLRELRGDLLAGALDRPREALTEYRQALGASNEDPQEPENTPPPRSRVRRSLREALARLGHWPAFLQCIEDELADPDATSEDRVAALDHAAQVALEHIGPDAALPWLERLRAELPRDRAVVARIAALHRQAGRHHALLAALEDELRLLVPADSARFRELRLEGARIYRDQLGSPAAAVGELESLRQEVADDTPELLAELDRLYDELGRDRERCEVLEARLAQTDDAKRRAETARLCSASLGDPNRAVAHWLHALALAGDAEPQRVEWLSHLAGDLERAGRWDAWTRAVEAWLLADASTDREASISQHQRASLQASLARVYGQQLGRSQSAAQHWRAILASAEQGVLDAGLRDDAERALLSQLREEGSSLEFEACLQRRLERGAGDTSEWLELARLRLETLAAPSAAATAFREVLTREPASRAALAGLRRAAESMGDWASVAQTLEWELDRVPTLPAEHRAGMARRLGELRWHKLNQRGEATSAFAAALEAVPGDLQTLSGYAQLCEATEHWPKAVTLLEQEVQSLGTSEPARRQKLWLRIARLSRDRCDDAGGATQAYREASKLAALRPSDRRRWAELHREAGQRERFVEVFAQWCDDPKSAVQSSDLLTLASEFEELGRGEEALERVHQAQLITEQDPAVWDLAARLEGNAGHSAEAANALERSAKLRGGTAAAQRLAQAALLWEASDEARACQLLRQAVRADPGAACEFARLAQLEERLERFEAAEEAARRALDLDEAQTLAPSSQAVSPAAAGGATPPALPALPTELRLACALAGGRAARRRDRPEAADRFFSAALALEPQNTEALSASGELLFERGDAGGACCALEQRLELGEDPDRAKHLAMIGASLLQTGDAATAAQRFAQALAEDPALDAAHGGLVRLHEEAGEIDQAVAALRSWTSSQSNADSTESRCQHLVRAAALELARDEQASAETLLREATDVFPASEPAWLTLCELVSSSNERDVEDVLSLTAEALIHVPDPPCRARLTLLRAAALERSGQREEAAAAFADVLSLDPLSVEAALKRGQLQRDLGRWGEAASDFREFLSALPGEAEGTEEGSMSDGADEHVSLPGVALIYRELGRLMAGPLEDIEQAIRCYERAVLLEPELSSVRDPLASLLTHFPKRWRDAVAHHREILSEDPVRETSLRCLLRIAKEGGREGAEDTGWVVMRALGTASPRELDSGPSALSKRVVLHERLDSESWELARRLLLDAAEEMPAACFDGDAGAFPESGSGVPAPSEDHFVQAIGEVLQRLTGAGFTAPSSDRVGATIRALAYVGAGKAQSDAAPELAGQLDRRLSRRAHKRLRRTLHGVGIDAVLDIDFDAWWLELRTLATAIALDEAQGDLKGALLSLLGNAARLAGEELDLCTSGNLAARIAGDPDAKALVRRVVIGWTTELAGHL